MNEFLKENDELFNEQDSFDFSSDGNINKQKWIIKNKIRKMNFIKV